MLMNGGHQFPVAGISRPLSISDFAGPKGGRPVAQAVALAELGVAEPSTLFTSPVWLKAYGIQSLVVLSAERTGGAECRLLFAVRDRHLVHLGRLLWFDAACLEYLAGVLFEQSGVDFVVFEDVQVDGSRMRPSRNSVFRYQRNWQIVLDGPGAEAHVSSSKSRSATRRRQRAMERDLGELRIELEEPPSRELLETIVALNRAKIATLNKKHGIDAEEMDRLWAVVSEVGHVVAMRSGSRLLAGDVICTVGRHAYYVVSGYDLELSRYSPGVIVHNHSIDDCRRRGMLDLNMLWGDGVYKRRLGCRPRELATLVMRRSPVVRFTPACARAVVGFRWLDLRARVRRLIRRQAEQ